MQRKIILALTGSVLVTGGVGAALITFRSTPPGRLETKLGDVSVERLRPPAASRSQAQQRPRRAPEGPCWLTFGGDPARSLARTQLALGRPTKALWAHALDGYIEFPPSYCDGRLYVNTYRGTTYAVDSETGDILWRWRGGGHKPSATVIDGPRLLVASTSGTLTALNRTTGRPVWRIRTSAWIESTPVVVGGTVYFASQDGRLFAANSATGRVTWAFDTGGRINASPSVSRNQVFITTYTGAIFSLRRSDGHKLWSTYLRRGVLGYDSFYASPSTDGARVYSIARSGKVVALSASTGRVVWTQDVHSLGYSTPAIARGRVFVGGFDGALRAYRANTGRTLWRRSVGGRILGPAVVVGNLVFFSTLEERTF